MGGQLTKALDRLGTPARMMVLAIAVVTLLVVVYLVRSAGPAAQTTAFTNLDPETAGDIQETLAGAGIAGELASGGTAIKVPSSEVDAARVAVGAVGRTPWTPSRAGACSTRATCRPPTPRRRSSSSGRWPAS